MRLSTTFLVMTAVASTTSLQLFDSHCHAGIDPTSHSKVVGIRSKACLMATQELDWKAVIDAHAVRPEELSIFGLGIHPWFAHRVEIGWEDRLRESLEAFPNALLGEIGLDKAAKTPETRRCEYEIQQEVFAKQVELAAELRRPISVHCVRAVGKMFGVFEAAAQRGALPPSISLHSYGASPDWIPRFLSLPVPVYVGFSYAINGQDENGRRKMAANIAAVPDDRLLLESDLEEPSDVDDCMMRICEIVCDLKDWTMEETAQRTWANAEAFIATLGSVNPR